MRNIITTIDSMLALIPSNRITYDLLMQLTNIRDRAAFTAPEIIKDSWRELNKCLLETFKPEEFQLQTWEQQVINILISVE